MVNVSIVLFWISLIIFIVSIGVLIYIIAKKENIEATIYIAILVIASVLVTVAQQLGVVFGTRSGNNPFFKQYFASIIGIVVFIVLLGYIGFLSFKVLKCFKNCRKEISSKPQEENKEIGDN